MEVLGKTGSNVILGHDDRLVGFGIDYGKYSDKSEYWFIDLPSWALYIHEFPYPSPGTVQNQLRSDSIAVTLLRLPWCTEFDLEYRFHNSIRMMLPHNTCISTHSSAPRLRDLDLVPILNLFPLVSYLVLPDSSRYDRESWPW